MVRQPAVAGTFYPADAAILRQAVKQLLTPSVASLETEPPKALIVPHAGYVYSGRSPDTPTPNSLRTPKLFGGSFCLALRTGHRFVG
jgi:hypothetical protein